MAKSRFLRYFCWFSTATPSCRANLFLALVVTITSAGSRAADFRGDHYRGTGDIEYLKMLETARDMFEPNGQMQNLSMLYEPSWNGFVEGPTWNAWWIQNSYGTTYAAIPLLDEPYLTFLQNAQDLWFNHIGDGKTPGEHGWVGPDGCLCDCANLKQVYYRQGDGKIDIHDWAMEFTAAGVLFQCELLLSEHDAKLAKKYLPKLERSANFIETRHDPKNDLMLAGPAGNLLAPSYAGWKKPDGTYGQSYLAGLSITYIAALDRLIEVEKLAGHDESAKIYAARREATRRGLSKLLTPEGYFIKSIDPDGTLHGHYGSKDHGYFESPPNHDAIAFRVVDDVTAEKIYANLASIPQLRPHAFVLPNYPSYDDMYESPQGLWAYGTWVNGGHWSTCEGRMILAYCRLGKFADVMASMRQLMKFSRDFRMDNPLTKMGDDVYQPNEPVNLCYDTFAPADAMMRGLFEYLYAADTLTLIPHVPPAITRLEQHDPARWGSKRLYLATAGTGKITGVKINGEASKDFTSDRVVLKYDELADDCIIEIELGGAKFATPMIPSPRPVDDVIPAYARYSRFAEALDDANLGPYESGHAHLVVQSAAAAIDREEGAKNGEITPLPGDRELAALKQYRDTVDKLSKGLQKVIDTYRTSPDPTKAKIVKLWDATK